MSPLQLTIMLNKVIKLRKNKAAKRAPKSMGLHIRTVSRRQINRSSRLRLRLLPLQLLPASGATAVACGIWEVRWAGLGGAVGRHLVSWLSQANCMLKISI